MEIDMPSSYKTEATILTENNYNQTDGKYGFSQTKISKTIFRRR
jgi:hypothetical protein